MPLSNNLTIPPDTHSRLGAVQQWRVIFGSEPPLRIGIVLLTKMIAQAQQESTITSTLRTLEKQLKLSAAPASSGEQLRTRFQIGDRIVRGWGGTNHEITALSKGFSYRGEIYQSLSEIARLITGARWSGPRFFGTSEKAV